ncbi:MAG TPA: YceI family protein [Candidatus Dormibacteraeota bacterium]|nr:YceI family protein [Candidatus Dormibacteraeota bacterium]
MNLNRVMKSTLAAKLSSSPSPFAITRPAATRLAMTLFAATLLAAVSLNAAPQPAARPAPVNATATHLEIAPGSRASYRVSEQLAGISFPDDAVGTTSTVSGSLEILPDGSIDSSKSKIVIGLADLKSDQDMRDGYVRNRTLDTAKYPDAIFVPRKLTGAPSPLPDPARATGQSGFQLTGDLTIHGVTKPVTLDGYATYSKDLVAGHAIASFTFATFDLKKPTLARLLSVADKIDLEIDFRFKRN